MSRSCRIIWLSLRENDRSWCGRRTSNRLAVEFDSRCGHHLRPATVNLILSGMTPTVKQYILEKLEQDAWALLDDPVGFLSLSDTGTDEQRQAILAPELEKLRKVAAAVDRSFDVMVENRGSDYERKRLWRMGAALPHDHKTLIRECGLDKPMT